MTLGWLSTSVKTSETMNDELPDVDLLRSIRDELLARRLALPILGEKKHETDTYAMTDRHAVKWVRGLVESHRKGRENRTKSGHRSYTSRRRRWEELTGMDWNAAFDAAEAEVDDYAHFLAWCYPINYE